MKKFEISYILGFFYTVAACLKFEKRKCNNWL